MTGRPRHTRTVCRYPASRAPDVWSTIAPVLTISPRAGPAEVTLARRPAHLGVMRFRLFDPLAFADGHRALREKR